MSGMKTGAGEDPFADDENDRDTSQKASSEQEEKETETKESDSTTGTSGGMNIPYKLRRSGVKQGRSRYPLFLKDDTKEAEKAALREMEDQFDENVSLTDLREAALKAGLEHLDEVENQLEEWGYGMTFEE